MVTTMVRQESEDGGCVYDRVMTIGTQGKNGKDRERGGGVIIVAVL